jgi:hypothetical protein
MPDNTFHALGKDVGFMRSLENGYLVGLASHEELKNQEQLMKALKTFIFKSVHECKIGSGLIHRIILEKKLKELKLWDGVKDNWNKILDNARANEKFDKFMEADINLSRDEDEIVVGLGENGDREEVRD